jgi:hypothetical protein
MAPLAPINGGRPIADLAIPIDADLRGKIFI